MVTTMSILIPVIAAIGSTLAVRLVYLVNQGIAFLVHHVGVAKLKKIEAVTEAHKSVIKDAIQYTQERYQNHNGSTKYSIVTEIAKKEFDRLGLPEVPEDQLEVMIHSTLKEIKGVFGKAWEDQVDNVKTEDKTATE